MDYKSIYDAERVDDRFIVEESHLSLICSIAREIDSRIDSLVSNRLGSRPSARSLLCALGRYDGVTQLDLARVTALKASTVSVALSGMEKSGIVYKECDKYDLRSVRVYLTDEGRELYNGVKLLFDEYGRRALEGISSGDVQVLLSLLSRVSQNLTPEDGRRAFIF